MSRVFPGKVDTLSYHRYGGPGASTIQEIRNRAQSSECENGNDRVRRRKHRSPDRRSHRRSCVRLAAMGSGRTRVLGRRSDLLRDGRYEYRHRPDRDTDRHLAQVFNYVRKGAVRIDATSDTSSRKPVAFINKTANGSRSCATRAVPVRLPSAVFRRATTACVSWATTTRGRTCPRSPWQQGHGYPQICLRPVLRPSTGPDPDGTCSHLSSRVALARTTGSALRYADRLSLNLLRPRCFPVIDWALKIRRYVVCWLSVACI